MANSLSSLLRFNRANDGDPQHIERALKWILSVILIGLLAIAVLTIGRPPEAQASFLGIAALAALASLGVGGALGLLFGLPIRNDRPPPPPPPITGANLPQQPHGESWYKDNTSLEQIAQWLTTAIVALTLVNFDGWVGRFDKAARALTCALYEQHAGTQASGAPGAASANPAPTQAPVSTPQRPTPAQAPQAGPQAEPVPNATQANQPQSTAPAPPCAQPGALPGGAIMALFALFGFLGAYLWSRRYLMEEFSRAVANEYRIRRDEQRAWEQARTHNLLQSAPKSTTTSNQIATLAESKASAGDPMAGVPMVHPGAVPDDPWKFQFGSRQQNDEVTLSASVISLLSRPGLFQIQFDVRANSPATAAQLAGQPLRVYLHPTFSDPIRLMRFDLSGQLGLSLVAYGAFTIGVQLASGAVAELDLALLPDAPSTFRLA